jgi:hypothetical protein
MGEGQLLKIYKKTKQNQITVNDDGDDYYRNLDYFDDRRVMANLNKTNNRL